MLEKSPGIAGAAECCPGSPAPSGSPARHGAPLAPGSTMCVRGGRAEAAITARGGAVPSRPVEPPRLARRPLGQSTGEPARPPPARRALPYLAEHLQVVFLIVQRQHLGGGEQRSLGRAEGTRSEVRVDSGPFPAGGEWRPRYPALRLHPVLRARAGAPPQPLSAGPQLAAATAAAGPGGAPSAQEWKRRREGRAGSLPAGPGSGRGALRLRPLRRRDGAAQRPQACSWRREGPRPGRPRGCRGTGRGARGAAAGRSRWEVCAVPRSGDFRALPQAAARCALGSRPLCPGQPPTGWEVARLFFLRSPGWSFSLLVGAQVPPPGQQAKPTRWCFVS